MTNIQDDQLISQYSDDGSPAVVNDDPVEVNEEATALNDEAAVVNDEQVELEQPAVKPNPSKADVDQLISQLDALHREIAAKTAVSETPAEGAPVVETQTDEVQTAEVQGEEEKEVEKLVAPPVTPMIESSDTPQLPPSQTTDADLDKFIEELEAKIAENKQGGDQNPSFGEKVEKISQVLDQEAEIIDQPTEIIDQPTEIIDQEAPVFSAELPEIKQEEQTVQPEPIGEDHMPQLQQLAVEENFSHQRPSLDLSEVNQDQQPDLTLNNGQLEEEQLPVDQPAATESPDLNPEEEVDAEDLESQNIFVMLGLDHLEQPEKEAFLDDLEKLIWDNFVEVELVQLLNTEEKSQADQILTDTTKNDDERKEALLLYLEKLIPNLEEIMYKKALLLKKEMFEERINKMRQQASEDNNLSFMADLDQIQELIKAGRYKTAIALLNKN